MYRYNSDTSNNTIPLDAGSFSFANIGNTLRLVMTDQAARQVQDALGLASLNEIMTLRIDHPIPAPPVVAGVPEFKGLSEFSDLVMRNTIGGDLEEGPPGLGGGYPDPNSLIEDLGYDWRRTHIDYRNRRILVDRRDGEKFYRLTRLRTYPQHDPSAYCGRHLDDFFADPATFHYPYRTSLVGACGIVGASCDEPEQGTPPWDHPFYVAIVDEFDPEPDHDGYTFYPEYTRIKSRRVVEMNIAGFTLSERTLEYDEDGQGSLVSQIGFRRQHFYDERGRIIAIGSEGWGSQENFDLGTTATDGLVWRFAYSDDPGHPDGAGEVSAVGLQRGFDPDNPDSSPVYWSERYTRHPERFDLVTEEARFSTPQANINAPADEATAYFFELDVDEAITEKVTARAGCARSESGAAYLALERVQYNAEGQEVFRGVGGATDIAMSQVAEFYATYREYNGDEIPQVRGQLKLIEEDSDRGAGAYARVPGDALVATPLLLQTTLEYDPVFGPKKITHANGRETHILFLPDDLRGSVYHQWVYRDVVPPPGGVGSCQVLAPVEYARYEGMKKEGERTLRIATANYPPDGASDPNDPALLITKTTPTYDSTGKVIARTQTGADGGSLTASVLYHASGQVERSVGPDGTIDRYVHDQFGRLSKRYQGTLDTHAHWGLAPPCELDGPSPDDDPNCPDDCPEYADNLSLIEKRSYGVGTRNANRLLEMRSYRSDVVNPYSEECANGDPYPAPNNEDAIGWVTTYEYDWRMREVWVTRRDASGAAISHTVTWLDHQNRSRIVAAYGASGPTAGSALDPRAAAASAVWPAAEAFLSASSGAPLPLSLTETVYNARGLVAETRRYFVEPLGAGQTARYTSMRSYYDHADRAVETHAPGAPAQRSVYDAKGRLVASQSLVDGLVITETLTTYDRNDRAIISKRWERRHTPATQPSATRPASPPTLTRGTTWQGD